MHDTWRACTNSVINHAYANTPSFCGAFPTLQKQWRKLKVFESSQNKKILYLTPTRKSWEFSFNLIQKAGSTCIPGWDRHGQAFKTVFVTKWILFYSKYLHKLPMLNRKCDHVGLQGVHDLRNGRGLHTHSILSLRIYREKCGNPVYIIMMKFFSPSLTQIVVVLYLRNSH